MWGREAYRIWAPEPSEWSLWAKPTLFAQPSLLDVASRLKLPQPLPPAQLSSDHLERLPEFNSHVAVVAELFGPAGVEAGLQLAERGWRPVPLYNATNGAKAEVSQEELLQSLELATPRLDALRISDDAPPAFLLDSRRKGKGIRPAPGTFDNRSLVFPQDFPSATRLRSRGITDVVVVTRGGEKLAEDLCHVLRRWQEGGLTIHRDDLLDPQPARQIDIPRPSRFRSFFYVALAMLGLYRNSAGGFGSIVPHPSSG
jgi:hypothetical protein